MLEASTQQLLNARSVYTAAFEFLRVLKKRESRTNFFFIFLNLDLHSLAKKNDRSRRLFFSSALNKSYNENVGLHNHIEWNVRPYDYT